MSQVYSGIGARKTPAKILDKMREIGRILGENGWTLRSGAADGADSAFEEGANESSSPTEIYLPWPGFNNHNSDLNQVSDGAYEVAARVHPAWDNCSVGVKKLHARNAYQVLGRSLNSPSQALIRWTQDARIIGGTATTIKIAKAYGVPVVNLGASSYEYLPAEGVVEKITPCSLSFQPGLF